MAFQIHSLIDNMLDKGIVVHGEIKIEKLTITSVSHAKSIGIIPQSREDEFQEEETNSHGDIGHELLGDEVVSREEFTILAEEIRNIKQLLMDIKKQKKR